MSIILNLHVAKGQKVKRGFAHWWTVMMDFEMSEQAFSCDDVFARSEGDKSGLRDFMRRLLKAGFIGAVDDDVLDFNNGVFRVLKKQSATPKIRRDGSLVPVVSKQQAMWNLMRGPIGKSGFNADDLALKASTPEMMINRDSARSYIKYLYAAGYLMLLEKQTNKSLAKWKLYPDRMTGPDAPMVLRTKMVFDPNLHEVMGNVEANEVQL